MMNRGHRGAAFAGLATFGILLGAGASPAAAQGWGTRGTPAPPSYYVRHYYYPTGAGSGYVPAARRGGYVVQTPVPQPPGQTYWRGYAPATGPGGYAPAPGATPGGSTGYYAPARPSVSASRPAKSSRPSTPPSQYREPGTGRNIFMHKPWLQ